MKKAIVRGYNLEDAERRYREYCNTNNIPCQLKDAVLLSSMSDSTERCIIGYYKDVIEGRVKLINLDIGNFIAMYNSCV